MSKETLFYAEVILPLPFSVTFTYLIPSDMEDLVKRGMRVIVPFGKKKIYAGVVDGIHNEAPIHYEAKEIIDLPDSKPIFTAQQLDFLKWMANYYMAGIGDALYAALPAGLKVSSESMLQLHPDYDLSSAEGSLPERELSVLMNLAEKGNLSFDEVAAISHLKNPYPVIKALLAENAIIVFEKVKDRYSPKRIKKVRLNQRFIEDKSALKTLLDDLEKKPKQQEVILKYLREVPVFQKAELNETGLEKNRLQTEELSNSSVQTLIKNNVLEEFFIQVSRLDEINLENIPELELNAAQKTAKEEILRQMEEQDAILLHGITGSGKTAILIELIREVIDSGHQVLYLMPEIALTTQMVGRLKKHFGNDLGVYHSRFSDNERVEVWKGVLDDKLPIVAGVRSSIFLPFNNLGLIIIDEEHEASFKQYDPAPRYHARDMAMVLARFHQCKCILSSATPSIETFHNAQEGKYGLVNLKSRFGEIPLPDIQLSDVRKHKMEKKNIFNFGTELKLAIEEQLENKKQVILFQNRRGYSPYLSCEECSWIPKCESCAVSLTFHQYAGEMRCHYCGFKSNVPSHCAVCESTHLKTVGFGTERIEEEAKLLFPNARLQRMDLDTTRSKDSFQKIIDDFEARNIDILIGTQMVSKGLDFDHVSLVGVMDADHLIHFPDFRSHERAFQMLTQVSGRAGRKGDKGKVIIQTRDDSQDVLKLVKNHNYHKMFELELKERQEFFYPPYSRIINITVKSTDKLEAKKAAESLYLHLNAQLGDSIQKNPPHEPLISKIRNWYMQEILLKISKELNLQKVKQRIRKAVDLVEQDKRFKKIRIILDVDPV